jgi:hypothetical protein
MVSFLWVVGPSTLDRLSISILKSVVDLDHVFRVMARLESPLRLGDLVIRMHVDLLVVASWSSWSWTRSRCSGRLARFNRRVDEV